MQVERFRLKPPYLPPVLIVGHNLGACIYDGYFHSKQVPFGSRFTSKNRLVHSFAAFKVIG